MSTANSKPITRYLVFKINRHTEIYLDTIKLNISDTLSLLKARMKKANVHKNSL